MDSRILKLKSAKNIYVYGAGVIGRRVFSILSAYDLNLKVMGYVVSDARVYQNIHTMPPIKGFDEIEPDKETVFVIALEQKQCSSVMETLEAKGFTEFFVWENKLLESLWRSCEYQFVDRRKGKQKVCFILAGYKEFLWEDIFARVQYFLPSDVEVCILSSGIRSEVLERRSKENGWSYLSTYRNNITSIQNIALALYDRAEWVYKMDEDIFLTKGCFDKLLSIYKCVESNGNYNIGYIAPLIPVNAYGYVTILEKFGCLDDFENRFEKAIRGGNPNRMIESDHRVAEYTWGCNSPILKLDELNKWFEKEKYSICGVRFSIGFILFKRKLWEAMGGFMVSGNLDLGLDEVEMCQWCVTESMAMVIAENTVVGHFSFGRQMERMKKLHAIHHELFELEPELLNDFKE